MSDSPVNLLDTPDVLSSVLARLELRADVYAAGDFCGSWAVDTSGSRRIPFHLVGRGEAWLHTKHRTPRLLAPGDMVVFPHDEPHVVSHSRNPPDPKQINASIIRDDSASTTMVCGFFEFASRMVWPLLDSMNPIIVLDLCDVCEARHIRPLIEMMMEELARETPGYYSMVNHLAHLVFIYIVRQQLETKKLAQGYLKAMFDNRISKSMAAMHQSPEYPWTLASLADRAGMSRSSFAKKFHELAGVAPMQYLTEWRMQEARFLLQSSNMSIFQIAEKCGYESDAAFRKAFKKTQGITPGQVRKLA